MRGEIGIRSHPLAGRTIARASGALRTQTGLARLAIGLLALHVADDNLDAAATRHAGR